MYTVVLDHAATPLQLPVVGDVVGAEDVDEPDGVPPPEHALTSTQRQENMSESRKEIPTF